MQPLFYYKKTYHSVAGLFCFLKIDYLVQRTMLMAGFMDFTV